ncbi:MAG TPA: GNAT family N-acetyltransferase [Oscillatoriaceae cyanobacterium]
MDTPSPSDTSPIRLVAPDAGYRDSYLEAIREFQGEGRHHDLDLDWLSRDFARYVESLRHPLLTVAMVPYSNLWMVDEEGYAGRVSLRHVLNDHLFRIGGHIGYEVRPSRRRRGYGTAALRLTLPLAAELGIDPALVTCDVDNVGSRRIIEANGGVLENELDGKLRFWVPTGAQASS